MSTKPTKATFLKLVKSGAEIRCISTVHMRDDDCWITEKADFALDGLQIARALRRLTANRTSLTSEGLVMLDEIYVTRTYTANPDPSQFSRERAQAFADAQTAYAVVDLLIEVRNKHNLCDFFHETDATRNLVAKEQINAVMLKFPKILERECLGVRDNLDKLLRENMSRDIYPWSGFVDDLLDANKPLAFESASA